MVKVIHVVEISLGNLSIWDGLYYRLHSERPGIWIYLNCRLEQFQPRAVHRSLRMKKSMKIELIMEAPSQEFLFQGALSCENQ